MNPSDDTTPQDLPTSLSAVGTDFTGDGDIDGRSGLRDGSGDSPDEAAGERLERISQAAMSDLVNGGQAEQWSQPLATPQGWQVPVVALVGGTIDGSIEQSEDGTWTLTAGRWYAVQEGTDVYRPAIPELAAQLTAAAGYQRLADAALAAQRAAQTDGP